MVVVEGAWPCGCDLAAVFSRHGISLHLNGDDPLVTMVELILVAVAGRS